MFNNIDKGKFIIVFALALYFTAVLTIIGAGIIVAMNNNSSYIQEQLSSIQTQQEQEDTDLKTFQC